MAWGQSAREIGDLVDRVRRNDPSLASLCLLRGRRFNDEDAAALAAALEGNTTLEELTATSHTVSTTAAAAFARALAANRTLRSLDLGNRRFGDEGLVALAPGIAASGSLIQVNLTAKGITASGCTTLSKALAANNDSAAARNGSYSGVEELLLGQNGIGGGGLAALLEGLGSGGSNLCLLDLSSCSLHGAGAVQPLVAALEQGRLPRLQVLRLDGNELCAEGAAALAAALGTSRAACSLHQLHLQRCSLGPEGTASLASALPEALEVLDLSGNTLGRQGAGSLAVALASSAAPRLRRLLLCSCGLDDSGIAAVAAVFGSRAGAAGSSAAAAAAAGLMLDLSGNTIGSAAVTALAATPLSALCLHDCKLGGTGSSSSSSEGSRESSRHDAAAVLAEQLTASDAFVSLQELDVSGNGLEVAQVLPLLEALMPADGGSGEGASGPCPHLRLLVVAANPGSADEAVSAAVKRLQALRHDLDVVRWAADTGKGGLMR